LAPDGRFVANGLNLVVTDDVNLITRRSLVCVATPPGLAPNDSSYAKLRRNRVHYKIPFIANDGKLYMQTVKVESAFHAEETAANVAKHHSIGAASLLDSDFTDFWANQLRS
jgi:hypothetical protein